MHTGTVFAISVARHPSLSLPQSSLEFPLYSGILVVLKCLMFSFDLVVLVRYSVPPLCIDQVS